MAWLRSKCQSTAALSTAISRIRKEMLRLSPFPVEALRSLTPFDAEAGVAAFLAMPLAQMVKVQRQHRRAKTWSVDAERALAALCLVPASMAQLTLSTDEIERKAGAQELQLLKKQESLICVHQSAAWLEHAIHLVRTSTTEMTVARIAIPLLLISGRRATEILNGKSIFEATARTTTCLFKGQIKKRDAAEAFEIPLLCDFATFAYGMGVLRAKQNGEELDAVECNTRYQKMVNLQLPMVLPVARKLHELRSIYAAFAYHLYASSATFNLACMRMLGHAKLEISLHYNNVQLHDNTFCAACFGALP